MKKIISKSFLVLTLVLFYFVIHAKDSKQIFDGIIGLQELEGLLNINSLNISDTGISKDLQEIAEKNIREYYLHQKFYLLVNVGELYEQKDSEELRKLCKTKIKIEYSIQHTYYLSVEKKEEFVQFDKDLNILGVISMKDMGDFVGKQVDEAIDFEKLLEE